MTRRIRPTGPDPGGDRPPAAALSLAATGPLAEEVEEVLDVSVVIPCLNEEATIGSCVRRALEGIESTGLDGEVVVVDGSTDGTAQAAEEAGARVVPESGKGYGRAYLTGFGAARGRLLFMGDGDGTYDFGQFPLFLEQVENGAEFVVGSRFIGNIHPGAMRWERRVGNFLLSGMLRILFRPPVFDAHCGMRLITRDALNRMPLAAAGMEFASEMIILAQRADVRMAEVPVDYGNRPGDSPSKLHAIRDGLRHVRYMLAYAGSGWFALPAALLALVGLGMGLATGGRGPAGIVGASLIGVGALLVQAWYGLRLYARLAHGAGGDKPLPTWLAYARPIAAILAVATLAVAALAILAASSAEPPSAGGWLVTFAVVLGMVVLSAAAWAAALHRLMSRQPSP
jgi:hypothetical protein